MTVNWMHKTKALLSVYFANLSTILWIVALDFIWILHWGSFPSWGKSYDRFVWSFNQTFNYYFFLTILYHIVIVVSDVKPDVMHNETWELLQRGIFFLSISVSFLTQIYHMTSEDLEYSHMNYCYGAFLSSIDQSINLYPLLLYRKEQLGHNG